MGLKFRYILGKVLGTQDRLTLRLASHYCVLHLNLDKIKFKTCILNSHTHTSIHLTINIASIIPKHIHILKQKKAKPKHIWEILACETLSYILKQGSHPNMAIIRSCKPLCSTSYKHVHHKRCIFMSKHDLPLLTLQQLNTYGINAWTCEWVINTSKQETSIKP